LLLVIAAVLDRQHASFWPRIRLFLMSRTSIISVAKPIRRSKAAASAVGSV
jgi:hypothetical protein